MKINEIAAKPQLIKLVIDSSSIVEEYGEPIEFWTWDRQPLETFMKLAAINNEDPKQIIDLVRTMILDEDGKQVITNEIMVPTKILLEMIQLIVEKLGK